MTNELTNNCIHAERERERILSNKWKEEITI